MKLEFCNQTGAIISLRNSSTKQYRELFSNKNVRYEPSDSFYEFTCESPYLVIRVEDLDYQVMFATIVSMPIRSNFICRMRIGFAVENGISVIEDGKVKIYKRGSEVSDEYSTQNYKRIMLGLGQHKKMPSNYYAYDSIFSPQVIRSTLIDIENLAVFMESRNAISSVDRYQIGLIFLCIIVISILIGVTVAIDYYYKKPQT